MERRRLSITLLCFTLLVLGSCFSKGLIQPAWSEEIYNTQRVAIYYNLASDLIAMERSLHFNPPKNLQQKYIFAQGSPGNDLLPRLTAKVEGLLTKVCQTLNAYPKKTNRLRIFLLMDGKLVKQRQLVFQPVQTGQNPPFFGYGKLEAFYEPHTRSMFLSLEDLHEGILAHEMAHHVLCEAYSTAPPHEIQEEWARYAEMKLN